jgi:hypothetical protein
MTRNVQPPAADAKAPPDAVRLTHALDRFRRRRRRVLATRFLYTGLALAVVIGEALSLGFSTGTLYSMWLLAGAAGTAIVLSLLAAAARTPSLSDIARLLDRRALLQNRTATALQFVRNDDVMATLVVRDAARRVAGLEPAVVFPREYPARPHLLVAAITVSSLVFAASVSRVAWAPQLRSPSAGMATPGAPAQSRQGLPSARPADTPGATPARGSTLATPQGTQARADGRASEQQVEDRAARADGRTGSPSPSPSAAQHGTGNGLRQRPPAPTIGTAASDRAGAGGSGAASPARDARGEASSAREGAGQGGAVPGRLARGGGGIKGGTLAGDATPAALSRPGAARSPDYAAEYQAAWTRAQAALAQDRVPPPLREYVRRYFAAIRSPRAP